MDYNAPYSIQRLSGRAFFLQTGNTGYFDLGNVAMYQADFGIQRKEHWRARRGIRTMDRYDAIGAKVIWKIDVDEFVTSLLPLHWGGIANADVTQTTATAATFMFTSKKGFNFNIGKFGLSNASLTTPASKTEGDFADYKIDRGGGYIYIPVASTIADATSCTVTYDAPALTYNSVNAFTLLNRSGTIQIQGEDDSQSGIGAGAGAVPPPRLLASFPCILSADDGGKMQDDDYRKMTFVVVATGTSVINQLAA